MGRLDNRVAIVTGAAHGQRAALGAAFAKALAAEGAKVTVADVRDCASVAEEITADGARRSACPSTCAAGRRCGGFFRR